MKKTILFFLLVIGGFTCASVAVGSISSDIGNSLLLFLILSALLKGFGDMT